MIEATTLLEDLSGRYAKHYFAALSDMLVAMARGNESALEDARVKLGDVIAETMGVAEVLGATSVLRDAARAIPQERQTLRADTDALLAFADQSILPRVTLSEAVQSLVDRTPTTIRAAAERTAQNIARLYGVDSGGVARIAFVRSAEASVTRRVQDLIAEAVREGIGEADAGKQIVMAVDEIRQRSKAWTEGYARMAFRTNVNTAVTAGRFRQAQDPDVIDIVPAMRFDAVGDSDTRANHRKADGLIFRVNNPVWNRISPPLGYACRCSASLVTRPMLRRLGRIAADGSIKEDTLPAGAHADEGFRHSGRPDLGIVGDAS